MLILPQHIAHIFTVLPKLTSTHMPFIYCTQSPPRSSLPDFCLWFEVSPLSLSRSSFCRPPPLVVYLDLLSPGRVLGLV